MREKFAYDPDGVVDLTTPSPSPSPPHLGVYTIMPQAPKDPLLQISPAEDTEPTQPPSSACSVSFVKNSRNKVQSVRQTARVGSNTRTRPPPSNPPPSMPVYSYTDYTPRPPVLYLRSEDEVDEALGGLNGALGFDLEWKVTYRKGHTGERPTAIVQLCDFSMILVIQVSAMSQFPPSLKALIEDPTVPKLGVNIRNDGMKLYRDYGILARNLVELGALACAVDARFAAMFSRPIVSLVKVVAFYLHRTLDKGPVRTSDWERPLTKDQIAYAANDAYCAVMVYKSIMDKARQSKCVLDPLKYTSDLVRELQAPPKLAAAPSKDGSVSTESSAESFSKPPSRSSTKPTSSSSNPSGRQKPQHIKAYTLWYNGHGLLDICIKLRSQEKPLRESTVISYVIRALEADVNLPFSLSKLLTFVKSEAGSWHRHRDTIAAFEDAGRGLD